LGAQATDDQGPGQAAPPPGTPHADKFCPAALPVVGLILFMIDIRPLAMIWRGTSLFMAGKLDFPQNAIKME
jgi:hypothetical protein